MNIYLLYGLSLMILLQSLYVETRRFRNCFFLLGHLICTFFLLVEFVRGTILERLLYLIAQICSAFLFLVTPFMLIWNCFIMIKEEGFRLANILSGLFGIMILIGEGAMLFSLLSFNASTHIRLSSLSLGLFIFYICIICLAFIIYSIFTNVVPRKTIFDYIIIHGAGLLQGEKVSKLLQERIDKAISVYEKSMSAPKFIVSGGKGSNELISEAQAMKTYMIEKGIPEHTILMEEHSTTTKENLIYSYQIIARQVGRKQIALITSNYHVLRAVIYAKKLEISCIGIGSHVSFYYWPSAIIREFIALMKEFFLWFLFGLFFFQIPVLYLYFIL